MASIMLQYDRPTDHTRNWHDYNGRVRDWIARLLQTPGAVSFMAYRTADGSSPNTTTMLEFGTLRRPDAPPAPSTSRPFCKRSAQPARTIPRCLWWSIRPTRPSPSGPEGVTGVQECTLDLLDRGGERDGRAKCDRIGGHSPPLGPVPRGRGDRARPH